MTLSVLTDQNPILRAERKHQWHVMSTSRAGTIWIWLAALMLIPALIASVILFLGGLLLPWIPQLVTLFDTTQGLVQLAFVDVLTMNIAMYLVVTLITLGLAANSINREKRGKTWDTLLLTSMSARQIVWGKWWATLNALWGDYLMVVGVRFGGLALILVGLDSSSTLPPLLPGLPVIPPHFLVFGILMLAYTALDAALTAALGVLSPLLPIEGAAGMLSVFTVRLLVALALVGFPIWVLLVGAGRYYLVLGAAGLVVMAGLTAGILWLAQWQAERGHAASPSPVN